MAQTAQTGYVSKVDFRAPEKPVLWDTTASACAACGLLEISRLVPEEECSFYYQGALSILHALVENYCDWNTETDGILGYGTVAYHREEGVHVPIIYGDYFLLEAILRLKGEESFLW